MIMIDSSYQSIYDHICHTIDIFIHIPDIPAGIQTRAARQTGKRGYEREQFAVLTSTCICESKRQLSILQQKCSSQHSDYERF